jgi:peptidoglycan-N-acetylglucosamine deacetylase
VKKSLLGKLVVVSAVLLAGSLPLLAGSPKAPAGARTAGLTSPLKYSPSGTTLAAGRLIRPGTDHTTTPAIPRTQVTAPHPKFVVKKLKMTPSGLVSQSVRRSIKKCYNTTKNVWLTFDDGYTSQANLSSILDTLQANNIRGRFFLIGSWARKHPAMVDQIVTAGHYVENHTDTHAYLGGLGDAAVQKEIRYGQASNSWPKLLRPPYGDGAFTVRLYNLAQEQGYLLCQWNTDTRDWSGSSASIIVRRVVKGDRWTPPAHAGDTVLMHLKNTQTRYALSAMIKGLRAKGLTFPTLR